MAGDREEEVPVPGGHEHLLQAHNPGWSDLPAGERDAEHEEDREAEGPQEKEEDPPPLGINIEDGIRTRANLG